MNEPRFTRKRIEDQVRGADVVNRAKAATNAAVDQSRDRLGTPGAGGNSL